MVVCRVLTIAAVALLALPLAGRPALGATTVEFDLVDTRSPGQNPGMNNAGTYVLSTYTGGFSYGVATGTIILEFQGDGTQIENGAVSIVGGAITTITDATVPTIIDVHADIASSFEDGENADVGTLSGWDGSSGSISWNEVPRMWPDDVWPGEGETPNDPGPPTAHPDTLGVKVANNGILSCEGLFCGTFGTPPNGVTREYDDYVTAWEDPFNTSSLSRAAEPESPYELSFPQFVLAYAITGGPAQELAMVTEGVVIVPEPGATTMGVVAVALLAQLRRRLRSRQARQV